MLMEIQDEAFLDLGTQRASDIRRELLTNVDTVA